MDFFSSGIIFVVNKVIIEIAIFLISKIRYTQITQVKRGIMVTIFLG